jgi:L-amino acid N-acyltransferase YncA
MTLERDPEYPALRHVGGLDVTLSYMSSTDADAILRFARGLEEHDLLFLRRDITQLDVVEDWLRDIESGDALTVLAKRSGRVIGYGTIHRDSLSWSAHVAELRVLVAGDFRGKGLGRVLTQEAFKAALRSGIEKMVARMTLDQKGAISTFESLGFRPEALLKDHVKDRQGTLHDLIMLSHRVADFESTLESYGVSDALEGEAGGRS